MVEAWQEGGKLLSNTPRGYVGSRRLSLPSFSNRSLPSPLVRESRIFGLVCVVTCAYYASSP